MADYVRRVTAWITQEQSDKIEASKMSDSDFIREAIDEKDYQFGELKRRLMNSLIDELINNLSDKKTNICQTSCQTNKTENDEIVRQLYSEMSTCQTNLSDKTEENVRQTPSEAFGESLQTVVNLLQAHGKITQSQKDVISNNIGISSKELQNRIDLYHDELMKMSMGH